MKKTLILIFSACLFNLNAQTIYVDSNNGSNENNGKKESPLFSLPKAMDIIKDSKKSIHIIKINPGIYVLEKPLSIETEKELENKRLIIEASILPDDSLWTPEKMPVIISTSKKGEIPNEDYHFVAALLINQSNVTIKGIKFPGYYYPNTRYFPIARFNKAKTDLLVEQCLFVGDEDASHLQVGVIAHGNKVRINHCIFYNVRNSAVFWQDAGDGIKTGNGISNSIIFGATQSGIWTASPDKDFIFKNNIISNCKHFWIKNKDNPTVYKMENCVVVNNVFNKVIWGNGPVPNQFEIKENNVLWEGEISLKQKNEITHLNLPIDYLHIIPNTLGYNIGAGLFKKVKAEDSATQISEN